MSLTEVIRQLKDSAPAATPGQSPFMSGWDAGYQRGIEAAALISEAWEVNK